MTLDTEVSSLRQVPLFRGVEPSRLKLLAFTSERVHFEAGQQLFARGDVADAAYLILDGSAAVTIDGPFGPFRLALLGSNALVGEMGILAEPAALRYRAGRHSDHRLADRQDGVSSNCWLSFRKSASR